MDAQRVRRFFPTVLLLSLRCAVVSEYVTRRAPSNAQCRRLAGHVLPDPPLRWGCSLHLRDRAQH